MEICLVEPGRRLEILRKLAGLCPRLSPSARLEIARLFLCLLHQLVQLRRTALQSTPKLHTRVQHEVAQLLNVLRAIHAERFYQLDDAVLLAVHNQTQQMTREYVQVPDLAGSFPDPPKIRQKAPFV